jgi:Fe2+ or Zn2+ uptake regulation protein
MQRRSTKQRETIYECIKSLYHPTSDEIVRAVEAKDASIGRATVFRNLSVLCEEGRLVKLFFADEPTRYDYNVHDHDHFVCRRCGAVIDLPKTAPSASLSFPHLQIDAQSVTYYGLCEHCHGHNK